MSTQTTHIARQLMKDQRRGSMIFNDRLADGRRSLKVWGWDKRDYLECQRLLADAGLDSKLTEAHYAASRFRPARVQYRLHVDEVI